MVACPACGTECVTIVNCPTCKRNELLAESNRIARDANNSISTYNGWSGYTGGPMTIGDYILILII